MREVFAAHVDSGHDTPKGHELAPETIRAKTREFCRKLKERESFEKMPNVAIVTAHADDEVIGYGTILAQLPDALAIQVTNSTPKVPTSIGSFETVDAFKAYTRETRRRELDVALNLAGHNPHTRECLGEEDQDVMNKIAEVATALAERFEKNGIEFVMTHAYEGGHPDHDAITAAVHFARAYMIKKGCKIIPEIIETPLYKGVPGNQRERKWQEFADGVKVPSEDTFTKTLTPEETELKREQYEAHASQAHIFPKTYADREIFRVAPEYNFNIPPNNGHVTDIFPEFGLTHDEWVKRVHAAREALGL